MKLKTIRTEAEVRAAADAPTGSPNRVSATVRDGSITEVRVGALVITSTYGMSVSRQMEHEEVEKWRVRVDHPAFPTLNRYFENEFAGRDFARVYENIEGATIDAKTVTVQIDDSGKVVAELNPAGEAMPLAAQENGGDEIPF